MSSTSGIILVHDLTNRKSEQNLQKWLSEILNKEANLGKSASEDYDPEQFIGSNQVHLLLITYFEYMTIILYSHMHSRSQFLLSGLS